MKASNNICLHFYELEHIMLNQLEKNRDWDGIGAKYTQVQEDFGERTPGMKKRNTSFASLLSRYREAAVVHQLGGSTVPPAAPSIGCGRGVLDLTR